MYSYTSGSVIGLPHSSHSSAESGSSGIQDGGQGVHERDGGHDRRVLLRCQVGDGAHQQPAGRAAHGRDPGRVHPAGLRQPVGGRDEVREGVLLLQLLAGRRTSAGPVRRRRGCGRSQTRCPGPAGTAGGCRSPGPCSSRRSRSRTPGRPPSNPAATEACRSTESGIRVPSAAIGPLAGGDVVRGGVAAQHRAFLAQQQLAGGLLRGGQHKVVDPGRREVGGVAHPDHGRLVVGAGHARRCRAPPRRRAPPARPAPACPARPAAGPARARSCPCGRRPPGASR